MHFGSKQSLSSPGYSCYVLEACIALKLKEINKLIKKKYYLMQTTYEEIRMQVLRSSYEVIERFRSKFRLYV